ncbi:MAG: biotin/lipoyl-binding protein [Myxococcaceae bacterium]
MKRWIVVSVIVLVIAGLCFMQYRKKSHVEVTYQEIKVERGDIVVTVLATGTVAPENRLDIKPPVAGRIEEVLVLEGQKVKKGQILAWMSSTERAALIDAARSIGPAEVKKWEENYKRTPIMAPINGMIIVRNVN